MAQQFSHLLLKNAARLANSFKKTRKIENKNEDDEEKNYLPHKDRLSLAYRLFNIQQRNRKQERTIIVPEHIDYIRIHFFPVFNLDLQKKFLLNYGIHPITYRDFNKTVLFSIDDELLFSKFKDHLKMYFNLPSNSKHKGEEFSLILLIFDFEFLSSKKIIRSYDSEISSFNLVNNVDRRTEAIYKSLVLYLSENQKKFDLLDINNALEVYKLTKDEINIIVNNFDIIQSVQTTRTGRIRPSVVGTPIREYGMEIIPDEQAPIVGVIDTGIQRIKPLSEVITATGYDLTGTTPFWDEHGHGTMVAGLITLGSDFFKEIKSKYMAKAYLMPIKVLNLESGNFSHNELIRSIEKAHLERGVKLFNLSINHVFPKKYNSPFSEYAFALDQLCYKYDLLIFISAGNLSEGHVEGLIEEDHPSHVYPNHFYCVGTDSPIHRCELTNISIPAESLNNVTVGAIASNYENKLEYGITPVKEYPAFYSRKFHYDYEQQINGTDFNKVQRNKNLNKPDVVFAGGDLLDLEAGIEVISLNPAIGFERNAGTSFSTPLVTSLAAQLLKQYPKLRTQTLKACLINSANSACGDNPIDFRNPEHKSLLRKLIGSGVPDEDGVLYSNPDRVTFVIEDTIKVEEFKAIDLKLPEYLNPSKAITNHKLEVTATLCYKFKPIFNNHLNYCPLHISFGIFKFLNEDITVTSKRNVDEYKIKSAISWSEDFFGATRLYSNVQKFKTNLQPSDISNIDNTLNLIIRCTSKKEVDIENISHPFSLVVTVTELPYEGETTGQLYDEIIALNKVEAIGDINIDLDID
jgi:hypothetical protein